ncbi:glycosyltransferase family 2 protein [Paraburkholderia sediminicola]|uniref:glycosyltransferase family 2 protein n=1 Tax=Paraburkholderia sediminicola TaxID=458836 RepID=UPI00131CC3B6
MSKVDIVIVNWNGLAYCQSLLPQIRDSLDEEIRTVTIVDNASSDGSGEYIKAFHPWVNLVQSPENVGYARGNNLALPYCKAKYILFLNNDTEICDESLLAKLVRHCERDSTIGAISPLLNLKNGQFQTGAGGYDRGLNSFLSYFLGLSRISPKRAKPFYVDQSRYADSAIPVELDWVTGAAVLMRNDVVQRINGWPDDYFMYAEDVKVCRSIRAMGYKICLAPSCRIVHFHGGTEDKTQVSTRWIDSTLGEYAYRKGRIRGKVAAGIFFVGFCLRWFFYSVKSLLRSDLTAASARKRMRLYALAAMRFAYQN